MLYPSIFSMQKSSTMLRWIDCASCTVVPALLSLSLCITIISWSRRAQFMEPSFLGCNCQLILHAASRSVWLAKQQPEAPIDDEMKWSFMCLGPYHITVVSCRCCIYSPTSIEENLAILLVWQLMVLLISYISTERFYHIRKFDLLDWDIITVSKLVSSCWSCCPSEPFSLSSQRLTSVWSPQSAAFLLSCMLTHLRQHSPWYHPHSPWRLSPWRHRLPGSPLPLHLATCTQCTAEISSIFTNQCIE